jgi:hypothetical protein
MDGSVAKQLLQLIIVLRGLGPRIHRTFAGTSENDESPKGLVSVPAERRFFGRRRIAQAGNGQGSTKGSTRLDRAIATAVNAG